MEKEFEKHLKTICHCSPDKSFLLALSGGIDSVVMAELFHRAGLDISFAHCNFHLRGKESDEDQTFVENMAERMKVTCHVSHFETATFAESNGISIQMAARELRYNWFSTLKDTFGYHYIVVGHNMNDTVETALINFSRGSGIRGLSGIKPRQGSVVRPLLFASRSAIHQYAEANNLKWREDSSNEEVKYLRNRIRRIIIPELENINPSFIQNAAETIFRLNQTEKLLNMAVATVKKSLWIELEDKYLIDIEKLREFPAVETLLYELLREFGCTQFHIKLIMSSFDSIPGKRFYTRTHCISRDRLHLIITKNIQYPDVELQIDPETALISYPVHITLKRFTIKPDYEIPKESKYAVLDAEKLIFPLKLRRWKEGDRFNPLGLKGSKKISDFLINSKISMPDKKHIWILESAGNIVWLVNHRIDDHYKITNGTEQVLLIEYKNIIMD